MLCFGSHTKSLKAAVFVLVGATMAEFLARAAIILIDLFIIQVTARRVIYLPRHHPIHLVIVDPAEASN